MAPRIVTLTLNPAVDLACTAPFVLPTHKIRTFDERFDAGGGGINVARVLHSLGGSVLALVMIGGSTGRLVEDLLNDAGMPWQPLPIRGRNRISLNVHDQRSGLEYRFVPEGPLVKREEWCAALEMLERVDADWVVASGSLPRGVPVDFYAQAATIAVRRGQQFVLDTSGPTLRAAIGQNVTLLKLSLGELEFLTGRVLQDTKAQNDAISLMQQTGAARMIAVSLGSDGAVLATASGMTRFPALRVHPRGAVGAGDSFLAGLTLGLAQGLAESNALAFAIAAGAAAVATYGTAQAQRADVEALYQEWCRNEIT